MVVAVLVVAVVVLVVAVAVLAVAGPDQSRGPGPGPAGPPAGWAGNDPQNRFFILHAEIVYEFSFPTNALFFV